MKFSRILRFAIYIFGGLFLLILLASILIPYLYKDEIQKQIDKAIAESVNADVNFDIDKFSVSLLRNFPNLSVSLGDLSVVGQAPFQGDTLAAIKTFRVSVDLWSAIFGDKIKVRSIYLDQPRIYAKVLKDGRANWDIAKASTVTDTTQAEETETETEFNVSIRRWEIDDARLIYDDASQALLLELDQLNHLGRGNFNQDEFDLKTETEIGRIQVIYDGMSYIDNKTLDADLTIHMNLPESTYSFKENRIRLNDFVMGFEGQVALQEAGAIDIDIQYAAQENEFKNILSLVPGIYSESFSALETSGKFAFDGFFKGLYQGEQYPAFGLNLEIKEGMFHYPDLPTSVTNVGMDLKIDNNSGDVMKTLVDLKQFHVDLGTNPVDARAKIQNLDLPQIAAELKSRVNLADLIKIFPMEGLSLRGIFDSDVQVNGTYSESRLPSINASFKMQQGYVKTDQYPDALEKLAFQSNIKNSSGQYADTHVDLQSFKMTLDGEPFEARGVIENLDNIRYDMMVKGGIDLEKITHLYPIEGMEVKGKVFADIRTRGEMSYIEAGQYDQLSTDGFGRVDNFSYVDQALLPQGFKITQAEATFSPQTINLKKMDGFLGKSDIHIQGQLNNYLAYLFQEGGVIQGVMDFNSNRFDLNEWMEESPDDATTQISPTSAESSNEESNEDDPVNMVVEIPRNIDFTLNSDLKEVQYGNLNLKDLKGKIIIKDGVLNANDILFSSLGGIFSAQGAYDPRDTERPKYNFSFGIKSLPLGNAYATFIDGGSGSDLVKKIAGKLNSNFQISGELGKDMMPLFDRTMNGNLDALISSAVIKDPPILKQLSTFTKLSSMDRFDLEDVIVNAKIENGFINYQPFNVNAGKYKMNVSGSNSLDGALDFLLKMDVPLGNIGSLAKATIGRLTGQNVGDQNHVKLNILVTGDYHKPKIQFVDSESGEAARDQIKEKLIEAKEEAEDQLKDEIKDKISDKLNLDGDADGADLDKDAIMEEARQSADQVRKEGKRLADEIRKQADATEKKALEEANKQGLLARKAAQLAARKAKEAAYKKADQTEQKANQQADKIIAEAQKRIDSIE